MTHFFRRKIALVLTIVTMLIHASVGTPADQIQKNPDNLHMDEWNEYLGTIEAEEVYKFRNQNSESVYFNSQAEVRAGESSPPQSVLLHAQEYIRENSDTAVIMFPGLRSPGVKNAIIVSRLWNRAPKTDFYVLDPRSQGRSGTLAKNNWSAVHVDDYQEYLEDFYQYVKMIHSKNNYKKIVLTGHSTSSFMLTLALIKYPDMQSMVSKVVLLSPAFNMNPKILGNYDRPVRLPLALSALYARVLKFLKISGPQTIIPGYPKKYVRIKPQQRNTIIKSPTFYSTYKRLVELEEASADIPPDSGSALGPVIERIGPTVSWLLNMVAAQKDLVRADLKSLKVPIEILVATKDSLVDNHLTEKLCKVMPNCKLQKVVGFHEILFDIEEISSHYDRSLLEGVGQVTPKPEINQTVVIAHRGLPGLAPESTGISYELAAQTGADYLEGDIQMTSDQKLILMHDNDLLRTTDVKEKFPDRPSYGVQDFSLQELETLDTGSWFNRKNPSLANPRYTGEKILPLEKLIEIAEQSKKGLYLEIKNSKEQPGVTEKLIETLQNSKWIGSDGEQLREQKVVFQSFNTKDLALVKQLAPQTERLFLVSTLQLKGPSREEIQSVAQYVSPNAFILKLHRLNPLAIFGLVKKYFQFIKDRGYSVDAWTVNNKADFISLFKQGVNGIFTDRADLAVKWRDEIENAGKDNQSEFFNDNVEQVLESKGLSCQSAF